MARTKAGLAVLKEIVGAVDTLQDLRDSGGELVTCEVRGHSLALDGGGGIFHLSTGEAPGTFVDDNGVTIVPTGGDGSAAWRREYKRTVSPMWFGAKGDGVLDDSFAFLAASLSKSATETILVDRTFLVTSAALLDTSDLEGGGHLINSAGISVAVGDWKRREYTEAITLEDEFTPHSELGSYTGFCSSLLYKGREFCVARNGYTHNSDFTKASSVVLYTINPDANDFLDRTTLYTSDVGFDLRDPNITQHPKLSSIAFIKFAEVNSVGQYRTKLLTINLDTKTVTNTQTIAGVADNYFLFGNTLISPAGYLITCSYRTDGNKIQIWKSTGIIATGSEAVTLSLAAEIGEVTNCSEPNISNWRDKYVILYRKNDEVSKTCYSYDLDNVLLWSSTVAVSDSRQVYSPQLPPYSNKGFLTAFGTLGALRTVVVTISTRDLKSWHTTASLTVAGSPTSPSGTNGYPGVVDLGGRYSIITFWDSVSPEFLHTRMERKVVSANLVDIPYKSIRDVEIIDMQDSSVSVFTEGAFIGSLAKCNSKYTSAGQNYYLTCLFKKATLINSVALRLSGTSTDAKIEIYDGVTLIATSIAANISSTYGVEVKFPFASSVSLAALTLYKFKITSSTGVGLYVYTHSKKRETILEFESFVLNGSFSSGDVSISTNAYILPVFNLLI